MASAAARGDGEATASHRSGAGGIDLLLPLLLVLGLNLPQLAETVVPINDTFYNFANFHIFYSELFFHGELARWLPYQGFGIQADYEQLIALGPASYLLAAVGWLTGAGDALLLFKLAAVLEQMAFVSGVWLLSRHLFATRATTWVLSFAAAGTTVWYAQQWWDLRIYYLLPLVLYFVLRFAEERRAEWLWIAGLVGVAWSIGNLPYLIPLWCLVLLVILAVTARDPLGLLRKLAAPSRANLLCFALFALAALAYLYFLTHALDHTLLHARDRDPITGQVKAETFRTYGGRGNFVVVLNALLFGWPIHLPWGSWADNSAYLGLLPLLGLCLAALHERSRVLLGLLVAAVLLAWLSFGGAGTRLAFHLPGLAYFRHVGLVFGLVKVLLLLAAGFGLERLWTKAPPRLTNPVLLLCGAIFAFEGLMALPGARSLTPHAWVVVWGNHFFVRLILYGAAVALCRWRSWRALGFALALALAADVALYQLAVFDRIPKLAAGQRPLLEATRVRELLYRDERIALPPEPADAAPLIEPESSRAAFVLATRPEIKEPYAYVYQFAHVDPCRGRYRNDVSLAGVDQLLSLGKSGLPLDGVLGCTTPKLRVVRDAHVVASAEEMRAALVSALKAGEPAPVVVVAADAPQPRAGEAGQSGGRAQVSRFTLGALTVEVDAPDGGWLVYADAYHPGWRAEVNGAATPVYTANLAFKAVRVPAGRSSVRLWFETGALGWALALAGLASAGATVVWIVAVLLRFERAR